MIDFKIRRAAIRMIYLRHIRDGKTKVLKALEDKPFFEKAMERVLEQLHQREQNKPD